VRRSCVALCVLLSSCVFVVPGVGESPLTDAAPADSIRTDAPRAPDIPTPPDAGTWDAASADAAPDGSCLEDATWLSFRSDESFCSWSLTYPTMRVESSHAVSTSALGLGVSANCEEADESGWISDNETISLYPYRPSRIFVEWRGADDASATLDFWVARPDGSHEFRRGDFVWETEPASAVVLLGGTDPAYLTTALTCPVIAP
jgi:hypothetical protein